MSAIRRCCSGTRGLYSGLRVTELDHAPAQGERGRVDAHALARQQVGDREDLVGMRLDALVSTGRSGFAARGRGSRARIRRERAGEHVSQIVRRHPRGGALDVGDVVAGSLAHEPQHECARGRCGHAARRRGRRSPRAPAGAAMPNCPATASAAPASERAGCADQAFTGPAGQPVEARLREMRVDGPLVDDRDRRRARRELSAGSRRSRERALVP